MTFMKFSVKTPFCIIVFGLFSCYSGPENANNLMEYSNIYLSKTLMYNK